MVSYLREFIIGASWPVFVLFFMSVMNISRKNYTYEFYTVAAPIYLGLMNVLSKYLQEKFQLTFDQRFQLIGILSPLLIIAIAYFGQAYPFTTTQQWLNYAFRIILRHFLTFNLIVRYLETNI